MKHRFLESIARARRKSLRRYAELKTRWQYGSEYDAIPDPFELIYVDPSKIERLGDKNEIEFRKKVENYEPVLACDVISGTWDQDLPLLEDYDLFYSLMERFNNGTEWSDTDFYQRVTQNIKTKPNWSKWGCDSIEDFDNRLHDIDKLYDSIKEDGYMTQRDIVEGGYNDDIKDIRFSPLEKYEITINIDRNGDYIFWEGRHRLAICKSLNIEPVPVRVLIRHSDWQSIREKAAKGEVPTDYQDHPDIEYIKVGN
jgi:hypothetical protein